MARIDPGGVPAPAGTAAIVVTSGTDGRAQGRRAHPDGHGGDGPRLLRRARRRARPTAGSRACRCTTSPASARWRARTSPACRAPCTTASTSNASPARRVTRARRSCRSCPRRCGACSTRARRCTSSGVVIVGGAPCPPALRHRAEATGVGVVDAYGLSETWGGFALDGIPIAGAEVRLAGRRRRRDPRARRDGDARVPARSRRSRPRSRRRRLVPHRRRRHDRRRRAGCASSTGVKDLVITGGVNVSPTEVEGVLAQHPDVDDVCVVGVPDDEWGELVVAFVVARAGRGPRRRSTSCARSRASSSAARSCRAPRAPSTRFRAPRAASRCGDCSGTLQSTRRRRQVIVPTNCTHACRRARRTTVQSTRAARRGSRRGAFPVPRRRRSGSPRAGSRRTRRASSRSGRRTDRSPTSSKPSGVSRADRRPAGCAAGAGSARRALRPRPGTPSTPGMPMK